MNKRLELVESKSAQNAVDLEHLRTSLDFQDGRITEAEETLSTVASASQQHDNAIEQLKIDMAKLEREKNSLERYTRSFNLRFLCQMR